MTDRRRLDDMTDDQLDDLYDDRDRARRIAVTLENELARIHTALNRCTQLNRDLVNENAANAAEISTIRDQLGHLETTLTHERDKARHNGTIARNPEVALANSGIEAGLTIALHVLTQLTDT